MSEFSVKEEAAAQPVATSERKPRIAQPPYLPLSEAIKIAEQIYEQGSGTADNNLLTVLLKNSVSSSSFTRKLQALRLYKLTGGMVAPVSLTDVGLAIVAPKDESSRTSSLKVAAVGPEPFRRAYERLRGKLLPQDEFLRNTFQHDMQLPRVVADAWVDSFKAALETAKLFHERPDGKTQVLEGPTLTSAEREPNPKEELVSEEIVPLAVSSLSEKQVDKESISQGDGHNTKIALADGRFAIVFIPDRLTKRDASRLKGALTGIAAIIDSMTEE